MALGLAMASHSADPPGSYPLLFHAPFVPTANFFAFLGRSVRTLSLSARKQNDIQHVIRMSESATKAQKRAEERRSLQSLSIKPFKQTVYEHTGEKGLYRRRAKTLQINIGLTCNLACRHCHVESSPLRKETMLRTVADRLIELTAADENISIVDITGGAPELHREFRYLVEAFSKQGLQIIDRCNLVVLEEAGQHDLAEFLAKHGVKVVASLPCYSLQNVEKQRGNGVFDASIRALQRLNEYGYGKQGSNLQLDLVYNPGGAFLPPAQNELEGDYKRELQRAFGITFNHLICIANMPIKRFADDLIRSNQLRSYLDLLVCSFNAQTVTSVMCLDMIHVAWDGTLYDCDFNYALAMTAAVDPATRRVPFKLPNALTIFDIQRLDDLYGKQIQTGPHCYGCTAGSGSSCGGSLTS